MALMELNKVKKDPLGAQERTYFRFIILGHDIFCRLLQEYLGEKFGEGSVALISKDGEISSPSPYTQGPNVLRGETNLSILKTLRPEAAAATEALPPRFFKDFHFRPFDGKSRPFKLLFDEDFFIQPGFSFKAQDIFPSMGPRVQTKANVVSIHFENRPQATWRLSCSENISFECEYLFFSGGIRKFYQLLESKEGFGQKFHEFSLKAKNLPCLLASFTSDRPITSEQGTLFLPQSLTHDWGHFIGEFGPYQEGRGQEFTFMTFMDEMEFNPEEISRKIRLMKRVLGRVFPAIQKSRLSESLFIRDQFPGHKINDTLFDKVRPELKNFFFLGMEAPLGADFWKKRDFPFERAGVSHLGRALASLEEIKETFLSIN